MARQHSFKQVSLTFRKPVWVKGNLEVMLGTETTKLRAELEQELRTNIDNSTPAGRVYRVGPIYGKKTRKNSKLREGRGRQGFGKVIVGYKTHRASAEGQPPARLYSNLYRSLKVVRKNRLSLRATVKAKAARILEDDLNRPYFTPVINNWYDKVFVPRMKAKVTEISKGR